MLNDANTATDDYDAAGAQVSAVDLMSVIAAALRRWKLICLVTTCTFAATYLVLKTIPPRYKSTVEILVYDPQQQLNAEVQKPLFPFVDALGNDAMTTEIDVLTSKSVALRVARDLRLDEEPEFQTRSGLSELAAKLGVTGVTHALKRTGLFGGEREEKEEDKLDQAADALLKDLQVWQQAYVLFVSATSRSPVMAQRLTSAIADNYLTSQREAREKALARVATWLKNRVDDLQSRILETEAAITKLKSETGISDSDSENSREKQIDELNTQIIRARSEVEESRARLDQARSVIGTNGDVQGIPELTESATLTQLRQKQAELALRVTDLQKKFGDSHVQVIAAKAELAVINKQISSETQYILANIKNSYDIALRQEQLLERSLKALRERQSSQAYIKLQQLQRIADADRKLYDSYLSQYNDIYERRTMDDASARIISPASLPRSPSSPRRMLYYALGLALGLGCGFLVSLILEYLKPGVRSGVEVESRYGQPVLGIIPLIRNEKNRSRLDSSLLDGIASQPLSHLSETMRSMRIGVELASTGSKVILVTSALPSEGKSTAAMLLAASSANAGKKTVLVDCDMHKMTTSEALHSANRPGLSGLLSGTATLSDVLTKDPATEVYVIPAGSIVPNAADLLISQRMRNLVSALRKEFDYVVIDTPPLLPVVDACVLAALADKILVVVEWIKTPRASILEAFKLLRPEVHRVAGVVLNKVDLDQVPGYGYARGYPYPYPGRSF